jgi:hypothetical protein
MLVSVGAGPAPTLRLLTQTYEAWGHPVSAVFFCLSVLLLNTVLYRARLVPRLIAGWALAAVLPYLADSVLVIVGVLTLSSPLHTAMIAPLALNELVLAIWLLTRGFTAHGEYGAGLTPSTAIRSAYMR